MLYRIVFLGLVATVSSLRVAPIRMSASVGDKFPAPALSKFGCSGKKVSLASSRAPCSMFLLMRWCAHARRLAADAVPRCVHSSHTFTAFCVLMLRVLRQSVIFFYGADDAPSCEKQIAAMDGALPEFKELGVKVVGVRNQAGAKLEDGANSLTLAVDEDDAVRNELEIPKDFFILGGRQSYVVDATGTIAAVHNNQFDTQSHVDFTLEAAKELPTPSPLDGLLELFGQK